MDGSGKMDLLGTGGPIPQDVRSSMRLRNTLIERQSRSTKWDRRPQLLSKTMPNMTPHQRIRALNPISTKRKTTSSHRRVRSEGQKSLTIEGRTWDSLDATAAVSTKKDGDTKRPVHKRVVYTTAGLSSTIPMVNVSPSSLRRMEQITASVADFRSRNLGSYERRKATSLPVLSSAGRSPTFTAQST